MARPSERETFRMSEPTITFRDGKAYEIRTCEDLIGGRWEPFITMRPVKLATERVQ
jgi:hypothetical protein